MAFGAGEVFINDFNITLNNPRDKFNGFVY